ncbi:serine protease FAM111A-like [Clupea harengus]|uniref:Serine protease FAM111A-like n=1 Tax=Clupea harengus TaxID=7950 RepID=A0A6P8EP04_CLUHA|nr:serine protease FAM111A-like [Clupea harengus]XP_031413840.1 serine protease FAM111A-like [Clupea harengus]XP_042558705.1 serine protease FAM111A-like [Clupea harengus]
MSNPDAQAEIQALKERVQADKDTINQLKDVNEDLQGQLQDRESSRPSSRASGSAVEARMPTTKTRIPEGENQRKGSTSLQSCVQRRKPAEMSTPAREPVMQAAGASQTTPKVKEENGSKSITTPSPGKVKEENDSTSLSQHSYNFVAKFGLHGDEYHTIHCDQPCTVLEAIQSNETLQEMMINCADENVIIQLGKEDKECIVATHFPCSCIEDGTFLSIVCDSVKVEETQGQLTKPIEKKIYPKDKYVIFYIDREGGQNTKKKIFFINDRVKQFKYLCVYGKKGMTVKEVLKRDGRFIDDLGNFHLSDNENPKLRTVCTQKVGNLHQKKFKICLPRRKGKKHETPVKRQRLSSLKTPVSDVVHQSGMSVKTALEKIGSSGNTEEIYERLRQQFPELRKLMESRFPGDSYQKALNLRKENFGKILQSFSDVHRVRKVLELGESVCKVIVKYVSDGTGFVLFDSFILTNLHLFKGYVEGGKLQEDVQVFARFGYGDPELETNYSDFTAKKTFVDFDVEFDYAILELNPEGEKSNHQTTKVKVPQGLLRTVGPLPQNGEACIIGHPEGKVKTMDPTWIIEIDNRGKAVEDHLQKYKDHPIIIVETIQQMISDQGIDDIMISGSKDVATYHTFMYHGASGSPVVDALGRVFGLHSAGFAYEYPDKSKQSVIEYAYPVLAIFKKFVDNLRESGNMELLERVKKVAEENPYLTDIITQVLSQPITRV